ncbi:MAG: hypothetical protein E6Q44_12805 [Flavobacteriales bacterium]|nr:MAG: hypothetical protein E6Q44_12805 [Flavobacteriales bacterium]
MLPGAAVAQLTDPGFEQGGAGWVLACPELTWIAPSTAPQGGSMAMALQATSTDYPYCPPVDPQGGWTPAPNFYQPLPQVVAGDVVRFKFLARLEEGVPQPSGSAILPYAITVDAEGDMHFPVTDLTLGGGNPLATWESFPGQVTVPELSAGHVFAIGFGAHTFGGGNGVVHFDNVAVLVEGSGARLNAKAWLDGAFVPGTNLMRDDLRVAGLIPTTLPTYTNAMMGPNAPAGTGISIEPAVLTVAGNNAIVDWVWVELHFGTPGFTNASSGFETVAKRYALIQRDGDIVDLDGSSSVPLPIKAGNCRVVVRHKNHLGVMSAEPLGLNATATLFDARAASTPLFALAAPHTGPARKTVGSTRTLWAGDAWTLNAPHGVLYTGQGNDRDAILIAIGGNTPTHVVAGYHRADINLNGEVKYTGENNDRDILLQTIGGSTPTEVRVEQVP